MSEIDPALKVPRVLPVYDNASSVLPIAEGVGAAVRWLNEPPKPEDLDPNELMLYKFPYRRRYANDGSLVSIPVKVKKIEEGYKWEPRRTNFVEDTGMFLSDHPVIAGLIVGLIGTSLLEVTRGQYDKAALVGLAVALVLVQSGLTRRLEADFQGVPTHMVKPPHLNTRQT